MRLACYQDFETPDGLYWPPYYDAPFYQERAERLRATFPGSRVLVAGCGWGFTVKHGRALNMDIWGCDLSDYALSRKADGHIFKEDVTKKITGSYDVIVTEDVLPMLTVPEIMQCLSVVRDAARTVVHIVTPSPPDPHPSIVTPLRADQWAAVVAPDRLWVVGG